MNVRSLYFSIFVALSCMSLSHSLIVTKRKNMDMRAGDNASPNKERLLGDTDNFVSMQNAYEGYNADSTMDQINRNLRDDLLDKIEGMVKRLEDKVTNLEGTFGNKMNQIQQSVSGKLNKLVEKIHLQTAALKAVK